MIKINLLDKGEVMKHLKIWLLPGILLLIAIAAGLATHYTDWNGFVLSRIAYVCLVVAIFVIFWIWFHLKMSKVETFASEPIHENNERQEKS